jgi:hypothetical protein
MSVSETKRAKEIAEQEAHREALAAKMSLDEISSELLINCPVCLGLNKTTVHGVDKECKCVVRRNLAPILRPVENYRDLPYTPMSRLLRERATVVIQVEGLRKDESLEEITDVVLTHAKAAILAQGDRKFSWTRSNLGVVMDVLMKAQHSEAKDHVFNDDLLIMTLTSGFLYEAMPRHFYSLIATRKLERAKRDCEELPTWFVLPKGGSVDSWLASAAPASTENGFFAKVREFLTNDATVITLNAKETRTALAAPSTTAIAPFGCPLTDRALSNISDLPWKV